MSGLAARTRIAKTKFSMGIAEIESLRGRLPAEDLRISYFANRQRLFEELISLLVSEGRTTEALNVAERARARALLDDLARPGSTGGPDVATQAEDGPL